MVPKRDFTDRFLKAIKPAAPGKRVIVYDAQVPGFGLRITDKSCSANKGAFVLVTRFPGSPNLVPRRIGDYPAMPLARAREIAREVAVGHRSRCRP
jgi:Arm DNA-binding domain